jgi:EAL and modified HD-GYP domain-containing signal transduction protein
MATPTDLPSEAVEAPADTPPVGQELSIARQAIVDQQRSVFGYELFDRAYVAGSHTAATDAAMLFNVLSLVDTQALIGKKTVFINCTHQSLEDSHLELVQADRVVLEVPPMVNATSEEIEARLPVFAALRARGFRLAFGQSVLSRAYSSWIAQANFIKLDMAAIRPELLEPLVKFANQHSTAQLIAEKVETAAQYERMSALGVRLFQGHWFATPVIVKATSVRPSQATILQLINLLRKQGEISEIEELLKRDPTLSFTLLRYINSSGFGLSCEISSFRHAVMILGMKKLFRWAALLMTTSRAGEVPAAVGSMAVVRGRLMELLCAELLPPDEGDNAFVVGVFSLLDTMLGIPLKDAIAAVALPEQVVECLLHRKGVFAPFLLLTEACESGHDENFRTAAEALQLSNQQVNWAHLQALNWAETLTG